MLKWFFVLEFRVLYSRLFVLQICSCQSLLITDFLELRYTVTKQWNCSNSAIKVHISVLKLMAS